MANRPHSLAMPVVRGLRILLALVMIVGIWAFAEFRCPAIAAPGEERPADEQPSARDEDSANRKIQMNAMRRIAGGVKATFTDDPQSELELIREALFRSYDPAREQTDGTIWGFGKTGRPAALLTLSLHPRGDGTLGWLYEMNSLASRPVAARLPGQLGWSTRKSGLEFREIPDAASPAEKEVGRTRQFRDLSARFTGFEMLNKSPNSPLERFELRLIPRPIHRYSDPDRGLVDGAIFLMTHSTNPEIIMVIEVVRESGKPTWKAAFARCAFAEVHVELDGKDFWTQPHLYATGAGDPYWLFFAPIPGGKLDAE